ncbi:MAG: S8 family peptidase [Ilumatobacteraceae bacterium]
MRSVRIALAVIAGTIATWLPTQVSASNDEARKDYIIVFSDRGNPAAERAAIAGLGGRTFFTYENVFNGVAVSLPEAALNGLKNRPGIELIEADGEVTTQGTQSGATWGLDRIDQRNLPLSGTYTDNVSGSGVDAYIIDTGILSTHSDFGGRVTSFGYNAIKDRRGTQDCNGHGTHVAGTVGGAKYGVAKNVRLIPVRVLDCRGSGSWSGVVAGMDWVVANHGTAPAVANMSLGGGASSSVDLAVQRMIDDGVVVVVAAGNSNVDACGSSPARAAGALTVGATTNTDARASYSNFGSCLDIFAPGSSITSAWHTSKTATNTISGTSMASPHVAGVAALILQETPTASVSTVISTVTSRATPDKVTLAGTNSPNRLLYSLSNG